MRLVKAKTEQDVKLVGVTVDLQVVGDAIEAVTLTDVEGNSVRICKTEIYSPNLNVLIPQPKVEETHIYVEGQVLDVQISKSFGIDDYNNRQEAQTYLNKLLGEIKYENWDEPPVEIVTKTVFVDPVKI